MKKLRVVTYNIHRAIGTDRRFRPERIVDILAEHRADVLLLQEVDFGVPRSRRMDMSARLAEELDYPFRAAGYNVRLREGMYGNATLSNLPILERGNIDLTVGRRKKRGCLHTVLELDSGGERPRRLTVFNLHLGLSSRERRQQLGLLVSSPEFVAANGEDPCVLAGDFNDWRSRLYHPIVRTLRFDCATGSDGSGGTPSALKTYPAFSPQGPLDQVYYRGGLELLNAYSCRHQLSKLASDHLPVIADFELPG